MNIFRPITRRYKTAIRDKAIKKAKTRILLAGRTPEEFNVEELEMVVLEEEDNIKSNIKEKALLAALALLGISLLG